MSLLDFVRSVKPEYRSLELILKVIILAFWRIWYDWRYWNSMEDRFLAYVKKTATKGDPASVLAAVEKYNLEYEPSMVLDPEKRIKTEEVVKKASPKVCFEMGCYIGLSAIAVGQLLPVGCRLITAELDPKIANVARQIIHFAGLDQVITVVTAKAEDVIRVLRSQYAVDKLDLVFIDHAPKSQYILDLKLLEEKEHLRKGTVIMADNILWPGCPEYLEYVEKSKMYQTERLDCIVPNLNIPDIMTISVYNGDGSTKL